MRKAQKRDMGVTLARGPYVNLTYLGVALGRLLERGLALHYTFRA